MGEKGKVPAVSSLGDLHKLLDAHASEEKLKVRVKKLRGICDATPMREILRHQEATKNWIVFGMKGLEALVVVDEMIGDASQLLNQAIAHMKVVVAAGSTSATDADSDAEALIPAFPSARRLAMEDFVASAAGSSTPTDADSGAEALIPDFPSARRLAMEDFVASAAGSSTPTDADADAETLVPAFPSTRRLTREDTASMDLAERMVEAGLGLCGGPLVPCAALLDLATRTLCDEGPSGVIDLSADTVEAGPAVRSLGAAKPAPAVCGLGAKDIMEVIDDMGPGKLAPAVRCLGAKGAVQSAAAASSVLVPNARPEDPYIKFGAKDDSIDNEIDDQDIPAVRYLSAKGAMETAVAADMSAALVRNARLEDSFITFDAEDDSTDIEIDDQAVIALAKRMMEAGMGRRGVPGPAIRRLAKRVLAADVITSFDITGDDGIAPAPAADLRYLDDFKTMQLAERMLEAGTGRRGPPCVPSPSILQLAGHVVAGDSPPRDLGDTARRVFTALLDSGTALRNHRLGSYVTQRAVQGLGSRIEDLASAVMSSRHTPALLLHFLHIVLHSLIVLQETAVGPREFSLL